MRTTKKQNKKLTITDSGHTRQIGVVYSWAVHDPRVCGWVSVRVAPSDTPNHFGETLRLLVEHTVVISGQDKNIGFISIG